VVQVANAIQDRGPWLAHSIAILVLTELVVERNRSTVPLNKPKGLSIDEALGLLAKHFSIGYAKSARRLPQIAVHATYQCIVPTFDRYRGCRLMPLERLKAAKRRAGSVGDIDLMRNGIPFEGVEVKLGRRIQMKHVIEAIEKIKTATVARYYLLSTADVDPQDAEAIDAKRDEFRRSNGCEIIVNGVLQTLRYYLRLLPSTTHFLSNYVDGLVEDPDLDYEHREAWNGLF